jgi:hypothetical protein
VRTRRPPSCGALALRDRLVKAYTISSAATSELASRWTKHVAKTCPAKSDNGSTCRALFSCAYFSRTEVRKLPKGTRAITGRLARFISVHEAQPNVERVVDCHIAPYENTRYTGERRFAAAAEAGLGFKSKIHGVFDMGKWFHSQFEERFLAYERSACADIMHVAEYLTDAGRVVAGQQEAKGWRMQRKRQMLAADYDQILAELADHTCRSTCTNNESGYGRDVIEAHRKRKRAREPQQRVPQQQIYVFRNSLGILTSEQSVAQPSPAKTKRKGGVGSPRATPSSLHYHRGL